VVRTVKVSEYHEAEPTLEKLKSKFINNFPMTMPNGTLWNCDNFRIKKLGRAHPQSSPYYSCWARVTAIVKNRTVNHLLIGMDETANFISPLPKKVKSIRNAHNDLRPKNVPRGALRQGEWFFIPATEAMVKTINGQLRMIHKLQLGNTTHYALSGIHAKENRKYHDFAIGYIWDNRPGHHKPLYLDKWHKCVHNAEAELKVSEDQREAASRRRNRAWD
jgi:hypothetical protein